MRANTGRLPREILEFVRSLDGRYASRTSATAFRRLCGEAVDAFEKVSQRLQSRALVQNAAELERLIAMDEVRLCDPKKTGANRL